MCNKVLKSLIGIIEEQAELLKQAAKNQGMLLNRIACIEQYLLIATKPDMFGKVITVKFRTVEEHEYWWMHGKYEDEG